MAHQAPQPGAYMESTTTRVLGSYYKLYRCSDGKFRLNLISEDEYLESRKRPISVCDVSSTTDVTSCSQSLLTSANTVQSRVPHRSVISYCPATDRPAAAAVMHRNGSLQRKLTASVDTVPANPGLNKMLQRQSALPGLPAKRTLSKQEPEPALKRQKRDRIARSTVAVADLIAEYIPPSPSVPKVPIQDAVASSTSSIEKKSATPIIWNNWIKSVGRRFPMADMSVRQVLDVLDQRPEQVAEE